MHITKPSYGLFSDHATTKPFYLFQKQPVLLSLSFYQTCSIQATCGRLQAE